jgi:membrane-associated protein
MSLDFISPEIVQDLAQRYGYWAIFFGILLENLGLPIPGETVTLAGGFLAGSDQLNYWFVVGDAALGATIGGNFGYWLGRWGGWSLLLNLGKLFRIQEPQLEELKRQFGENAGKAIFLGRFIALLRIFASPLAGIAEIPYWKFSLYNIAGAVTWASVMVTLAFFAGQILPLEKLMSLASQFGVVALLLVVAWIVVPFWLESRKAKQSIAPVHQPAGDSE